MLIVRTETGDVFLEDVCEEEVNRDFPACYTTRAESLEDATDTARLLNQTYNTFRFFIFQHLR